MSCFVFPTVQIPKLFKVKVDDFFGETLSLWCVTWLNCVIIVKKWRSLMLNWSPISPVFTVICSLVLQVFPQNVKSVTLSALLSNRWPQYELIGSPCSDSLVPAMGCLQATGSFGSNWLWEEFYWNFGCNFSCNRLVSVQTGLKRERQQTK